jgi:hypothetical protein
LRGSVRFAEAGIADVWFALLPHDDRENIHRLEQRLIPIAENWNRRHGLASLLNIEFM